MGEDNKSDVEEQTGEITRNDWNKSPNSPGKIWFGDCLDGLREMDSNSITLGFTSPPYFDAVNYEEHVKKKIKGEGGQWEREDEDYEAYRQFLMERFEELFRVTKPGGHTIVNLSPVHSDGERVPLPYHFVLWMEKQGWKFKEDIIWEKPVAKDRRSGVLLQHPYPGYYYPSVVAEYVLVFQKEADSNSKNNIYWNRSEKEKEENKIDVEVGYQGEKSKNVWKIRPVAPSEVNHPAPFPQKLAERVIELYSYSGDTIADIFGGSGTTYVAAKELGREFVGFETQEEYVKISLERLAEYTPKEEKRSEKIENEIDKITRKISTLEDKKNKLQNKLEENPPSKSSIDEDLREFAGDEDDC